MALPDIELLLNLSKLYGVSINELLEDNSLLYRLSNRPFLTENGIACYTPSLSADPAWRHWECQMHEEKWVHRNWRNAWSLPGGWEDNTYEKNHRPDRLRIGKQLAQRGGVILEIGAGPGGGYMPYILQADPTAQIIIADLSHGVVREWKQFLDKELDSPHLCFAAMDFCDIPFGDCTVDVVSDHGAIINCIGNRRDALREVYRVLKPGGLLVSLNGFVTKETLSALPQHAQDTLIQEYPNIFDNLYEDTVLAGFQKIDSIITGGWSTEEDESAIADFVRSLGVNVQFTEYVRFCEK